MRSINKRELFIQAWDLFKGNAQFLINVGILIFLIQMLIPNLLDSLFDEMNLQYLLYRFTYLLLVTGITLGVTSQLIKITRLVIIDSYNDIFKFLLSYNSTNKLGLGISIKGGPLQFYFLSDNIFKTLKIFRLNELRSANLNFGINFIF